MNSDDFEKQTEELNTNFNNVVGSLTLFAPFSHEIEKDSKGIFVKKIKRPETPIENEISGLPKSLEEFQQLVRRRVQPETEHLFLTVSEQFEMIAIIQTEISNIWNILKVHVDYPFFNSAENEEMIKRVIIFIVTSSLELFKDYLRRAKVLIAKNVFTKEANFVRLKLQLTVDVAKYLNIDATKRYIFYDIMNRRKTQQGGQKDCDSFSENFDKFNVEPSDSQSQNFSSDYLWKIHEEQMRRVRDIRPELPEGERSNSQMKTLEKANIKQTPKPTASRLRPLQYDIDEMISKMPAFDSSKLESILKKLPHERMTMLDTANEKISREKDKIASSKIHQSQKTSSIKLEMTDFTFKSLRIADEAATADSGDMEMLLRRRNSMPELHKKETTLAHIYEINIEKLLTFNEVDDRLLNQKASVNKLQEPQVNTETVDLEHLNRETLDKDLQTLKSRGHKLQLDNKAAKKEDVEEDESDDDNAFPNMMVALPCLWKKSKSSNGDAAYANERIKKQQEQAIEDKENKIFGEQKAQLNYEAQNPMKTQRNTFYPQPFTVCRRIQNQVMEIPDFRPTERKMESDMSLNLYSPIWNPLLDEIDPKTEQKLDANLLRGNEVKLVYKEIMKTVSRDHMDFANDPMFEPCPESLNIASVLSSNNLEKRRRRDRIINSQLKNTNLTLQPSPWIASNQSKQEWQKPDYSANSADITGLVELNPLIDTAVKSLQEQKNRFVQQLNSNSGNLASSSANVATTSVGVANDKGPNAALVATAAAATAVSNQFLATSSSSRGAKGVAGGVTANDDHYDAKTLNAIEKQMKLLDYARPDLPTQYTMTVEQFSVGIQHNVSEFVHERLVRAYTSWLNWWKEQFDMQDYMKFLSKQPSDFAALIFKLYSANPVSSSMSATSHDAKSGASYHPPDHDNDEVVIENNGATEAIHESDNDDEDGEYVSDEIRQSRMKLRRREIERQKILALKLKEKMELKKNYQAGLWNTSSVLYGGLGKIPSLTEYEKQEFLSELPPIDMSHLTSKRSSYIRCKSAARSTPMSSNSRNLLKSQLSVSGGGAVTTGGRTGLTAVGGGSSTISPYATAPPPSQALFPNDKLNKSLNTRELKELNELENQEKDGSLQLRLVQNRLEAIWTALKMPAKQRLDMVIKYGSMMTTNFASELQVSPVGHANPHLTSTSRDCPTKLDLVLDKWEKSVELVEHRERLISQLQHFERKASDVNRYFVKGYRGSSHARFDEARIRAYFDKALKQIDTEVTKAVQHLKQNFNDVLTYAGRHYLEKMKFDRIEMLYWLQEEKRKLTFAHS